MSDEVRVVAGGGAVVVRRSGIKGHVMLQVEAPGGGVTLCAADVGLVVAAALALLPQGGRDAVVSQAPPAGFPVPHVVKPTLFQAPGACWKCHQSGEPKGGEHPCSACSRPTVHDEVQEMVSDTAAESLTTEDVTPR